MRDRNKESRTVAITGCEHVGVTAVYSLARSRSIDRVIAIGDNAHHLSDQVNALLNELEVDLPKVQPGTISDLGAADVVVIAAAPSHVPDEAVHDRIHRAEQEVRAEVREVMASGFDGVLVIASNPTDAMAAAAFSESGLPYNRVFGLAPDGTVEGVTWCSGIHGANYIDNCDPTCPFFDKVLSNYQASTQRPESAQRSLATCVTRICEAIFDDEHAILPVAALSEIDCRTGRGFIKMRCIIGRNGVERRLENGAAPEHESVKGRSDANEETILESSEARPRQIGLI